uniref:Uncharacterized protein n=1 Tax=mine drainage metagenome TaxID=410659 RepID=E6QJM4_9ZZZZ
MESLVTGRNPYRSVQDKTGVRPASQVLFGNASTQKTGELSDDKNGGQNRPKHNRLTYLF